MSKMGRFLTKNSAPILTCLGATGVVTTAVMAVKATPIALELIEEARTEITTVETEDGSISLSEPSKGILSKQEIVKITWKCYIPAAIMGSVSIACIIGAHRIGSKRVAALGALYSVAETSLKEYQTKVAEVVGENKANKIKDEIAKDKIEQNPASNSEVMIIGGGEHLCYEEITGRYFKSDIEKIKQTVNEFNSRLLTEMSLDLNELYYDLGLPSVKFGSEVGWQADNLVELDFSSHISDDGQPCVVLGFNMPRRFD